jgi:hypothetical protein
VGTVTLAATVFLSAASATPKKPLVVPPDAVLTWNNYAVQAVRTSTPTKVQTDGMVYMSYVQAAVYDAVVTLEGGYEPYHDFTYTVPPGTSAEAAVAAAAQTTLDHYLPDRAGLVDAEYNALGLDLVQVLRVLVTRQGRRRLGTELRRPLEQERPHRRQPTSRR